MTVLWTAEDVVAATRGTARGTWQVSGISIDSRKVCPGDLFIALKGPNFDGHQFVEAALDAGCAAAMISDQTALHDATRTLLVDDSYAAMVRLAQAGRARSNAKIIAVTGSVGKTSIKEALRYVLGRQAVTHASPASFNNHWGVPVSLASLPPDAQYGVFEIGMNHEGEITPLSRMVRPSIAMITNVVTAHSAYFGNEQDIARAKAEIFKGVAPHDTVILNRDNRYFFTLASQARALNIADIRCFGIDAVADYRLFEAVPSSRGSVIRARIGRRHDIEYAIGCPGTHWVLNSLAVLAAVEAVGGDVLQAAQDLADFTPPDGRGAHCKIALPRTSGGEGFFTLIDDAYNANPTSMLAGLRVLASSRPDGPGRKIAILGDMHELGERQDQLHADLAQPIVSMNIDGVYTVGPLMAALRDSLPEKIHCGHFNGAEEAIEPVSSALGRGDVVLIKGSSGSYVSKIVSALKARG